MADVVEDAIDLLARHVTASFHHVKRSASSNAGHLAKEGVGRESLAISHE